jgi:predicted branched-subunit amino acid permease
VATSDVRAGAASILPLLVGVIPFGLVAGATPAADGLGVWAAIGLSTIVSAGASQLAVADVLADGGSALVATVAACTINLRMLLYSASLDPHLAHEPLGRRLGVAYFLTDQAYAVSISRWSSEDPPTPSRRLPYYFGAGCTLWLAWQVCTVVGALAQAAVPDELPLDFAVPLVFLVLLVPAITSRPALVAATAGGGAAVMAAELGAGSLSILVGAVAGIVGGAAAEAAAERRLAGRAEDRGDGERRASDSGDGDGDPSAPAP